jgi:hypothetical protein
MPCLDNEWNGDLTIDGYGMALMAQGEREVNQRIIRRCCTSPRMTLQSGYKVTPGYIFHPDYGVGCRRLVNELINQQLLTRLQLKVTTGVQQDENGGADPNRPPRIVITQPEQHKLAILIQYWLLNGAAKTVSFTIGRRLGG